MRELSIFIDESGDFGDYEKHNPYYLISMVFHDQSKDISMPLKRLNACLSNAGFSKDYYIHTGPAIRKEGEYYWFDLDTRRYLIANLFSFFRRTDTKYRVFSIEKRQVSGDMEAVHRLTKQISQFIRDNLESFLEYDVIKLYYDNGQSEVTKILLSVFNSLLQNVDFRNASPRKYKLFQAADLVCTLHLLQIKMKNHRLSRSELIFFKSARKLKDNYLRPLSLKIYK